MSRTDFATPSGQEDGIKACHLGTLGLDVLALNTAYNASFLVDLQRFKNTAIRLYIRVNKMLEFKIAH